MFRINGKAFWEIPCMCGDCRFFISNGKGECGKQVYSGYCTLFSKQKNYYANLPKRCRDMFDKAASYPDGTELCLVEK